LESAIKKYSPDEHTYFMKEEHSKGVRILHTPLLGKNPQRKEERMQLQQE
jgi:hypothetical protein